VLLHLQDPKLSTKKLLDAINSFSKVAGYKINLQKSVAFLYTNIEQIEKEYRKTIPFIIPSKKNQIPKNDLNKGCNDLYKENYKPWKKEIKGDYRRLKDLPCPWIGRINIVKMAYTTKSNLHVQHHSHQNPNDIHHGD
jgi:hypothetical protein